MPAKGSSSSSRWSVEETDALLLWLSNPVNLDSYKGGKAEACRAISTVLPTRTASQVTDKLAAGSAVVLATETKPTIWLNSRFYAMWLVWFQFVASTTAERPAHPTGQLLIF
jgi:hypothetical protein